MNIQTLALAYWGEPGLKSIRECDRIQVADENAFTNLEELLPKADVSLRDYF